eukprot:8163444-Pyramimonas_sp.AAC.1
MAPPFQFGAPLARFVAPEGAPPKAPVGMPAWRRRVLLAHPSHGSWPHWELHRRPQWENRHGAVAGFWRNLRTVRGPRRELFGRPQWE